MFSSRRLFAPVFAGALSLSAVFGCGSEHDLRLLDEASQGQAIINGDACSEDEQPTAVAILIDAEVSTPFGDLPMKTPVCTGTLIAPDTVLAAAHCIDEEVLLQQFFGFGEITRIEFSISRTADLAYLHEAAAGMGTPPDFPDDAITVSSFALHESFDINGFQAITQNNPGPGDYYDVAVLFMSETIDDIEPEVVITADEVDQLVVDATVEIAGWGKQVPTSGFEQPPAGTVGIKVCGESFINEIGDTEFQVGDGPDTVRKCQGDSGGPTYMHVETDHERTRRVVGITSHSYDETLCERGGVDTKVSSYLEWIDTQMRAGCSDDSRVWCEEEGIIPPSFYDPPEQEPDTAGPDGEGNGDGDDDDTEGCNSQTARGGPAPVLSLALLGLLGLLRRRRA